jgi:hypothetical protein
LAKGYGQGLVDTSRESLDRRFRVDVSEITNIFQQLLGRVEAVGITLGVDLLNMAETMGKELKDMGYDLVQAAETGQTG